MAADPIDERYDEIVHGLRALPGAPAELRGRVLELAAAADRPRRRGLTVAVALGLLVAAAVAGIVLGGGGSKPGQKVPHGEAVGAGAGATRAEDQLAPAVKHPPNMANPRTHLGSINLPVSPTRLTDVHASLRLRVTGLDSLSKTTARAMRITRNLGGFVQSVDFASARSGPSYLTLRIPIAHVQQAVVRFSGLGTILSQQVSIRDLQDAANAEAVKILPLRRAAAPPETQLRGAPAPGGRGRRPKRLDAVRGLLRLKTQQHAGTLRPGRRAHPNPELH